MKHISRAPDSTTTKTITTQDVLIESWKGYFNRSEFILELLETHRLIDPNARTNHGNTLLHHMHAYPNIVKRLLELKADPNVTDAEGKTALAAMRLTSSSQTVRLLLEAKAGLQGVDMRREWNSLISDAYSGDESMQETGNEFLANFDLMLRHNGMWLFANWFPGSRYRSSDFYPVYNGILARYRGCRDCLLREIVVHCIPPIANLVVGYCLR